jgi:hypothetical protein
MYTLKSKHPTADGFLIFLFHKGTGKGKVVLCFFLTELHAMKAYWGVEV